MKDYGEPVALKEFDEDGFYQGWAIVDKDGDIIETFDEYLDFPQDHKEFIDRSTACVNALQGIPTDQLGEVKKAWLAIQISELYLGRDYANYILEINGDKENVSNGFMCDRVIEAAFALRYRGADFGELNALIDSVKE